MAGEIPNAEENLLLAGAADPDAWDDTALIAAYDEAVARARELALGDSVGSRAGRSAGRQPQHGIRKQQQQQQQRKQPQKKLPSRQWRIGDSCRAVWSEDGVEYRARVVSLTSSDRCIVEFVDYGNSEEQALADLLPPGELEDRDASAAAAGVSAIDNCGLTDADISVSFHHQQAQPPPPPPPPLPSLPGAASASMDESTYNMLMSWYMSGYYTGYYVGRKEAKQQ